MMSCEASCLSSFISISGNKNSRVNLHMPYLTVANPRVLSSKQILTLATFHCLHHLGLSTRLSPWGFWDGFLPTRSTLTQAPHSNSHIRAAKSPLIVGATSSPYCGSWLVENPEHTLPLAISISYMALHYANHTQPLRASSRSPFSNQICTSIFFHRPS